MNAITNLLQPSKLLVSWQPADGLRSRLVVGEIDLRHTPPTFRYLRGTGDFKEALKNQFLGYPAFALDVAEHSRGVLDAFMSRLPSRSRQDFPAFLEQHRLGVDAISDAQLLAYTGARLPSDSFEIVPVFDGPPVRAEFLLQAAGFRHQGVSPAQIAIGDQVAFRREPHNAHDQFAVSMHASGMRIGYVNRLLSPTITRWMQDADIAGAVDRVDAYSDRPMVYVLTTVRPKLSQ